MALATAACDKTKPGANSSSELDGGSGGWSGVCVDPDQDGYGFQCEKGDDCDDTDPTLNVECGCNVPNSGCACAEGTEPVECVVKMSVTNGGELLCKTGERYCRDGAWTECVGVRSFTVPAPAAIGMAQQALVDQDAAPAVCSPCSPDCYGVVDSLDTIEADPDLKNDSGGLTLKPSTPGSMVSPDTLDPTPGCTPGTSIPAFSVDTDGDGDLDPVYDDDCDGIPDNYDNSVGLPGKTPPFATSHAAITMDLGQGDMGSNTFELTFVLKTVDVYFLLDTTASMDGELSRLITDLTTGSFLDNPSTPANEANDVVCASPLGSTTTDPTLKTKGIAGNIACKVPNAAFGAGLFREIPFDNKDAYNQAHAYDWFIPYEHRQDIDTDVNETLSALKLFYTAGNVSWPEDDIYALQAVATGAQIYTGWDRPGTESKSCPDSANYFGYPCFRKSALPVVVLITDASIMNGPNVDIYNNTQLSNTSCVNSTSPFTVYTQTCVTDSTCQTTYGSTAFCKYKMVSGSLSGNCAVPKTILYPTCTADGIPDGINDDYYRQAVNYTTAQTNTMSVGTDPNYRKVSGNETFGSAYDVGVIDSGFVTYVGDTRGMSADVTSANLGASCSQWPTSGNAAATSETTPGYPDAVFKFSVSAAGASKTMTISTAGSHHAPTLAIISEGNQGVANTPPTQLTAPASSDSTPYEFTSTGTIGGNFDYSVGVDLSTFTGQWRRAAFGACMDGAPGASDYGPDAIFSFTPDADMDDVTFSVGSQQIVATNDADANDGSPSWPSLGTQLGQLTTYYGATTSTTTAKWSSTNLGSASCRGTSGTNREHLVKFRLDAAADLELRLATPSTFDSVISVFGPYSNSGHTQPAIGGNFAAGVQVACNRTSNADDVISRNFAAGTYYVMVHGYTSNAANTYGTYTLTIKEQSDEAIVLYDTVPSEPTEFDIDGPKGANSNDNFFAYTSIGQQIDSFHVGDVDGQTLIFNAGDTSATNIHADFLPSSFQQAQGTCQTVTGSSNDAVITFNVDSTRTVRIETNDGTGATADQAAGFDHVVAIVERPANLGEFKTAESVSNNDNTATAREVLAEDVPELVGDYKWYKGATYGNNNTLPMTSSISPLVMYDPANQESATCSSVTNGLQDVVFKFVVDQDNEGYYDFDTEGSQSTTFLSLHDGSPEALTTITPRVTNRSTPVTNNTAGSSSPTGAQSGMFLGSADGKTLTYSDTTTASTSNKWTDAQFAGCRLSPSNNQAHEQVVSFSLSSTRLVTITATQTSPFDASIALFSTAPVAQTAQPNTSGAGYKACSRISGSPSANPGGLTAVGTGTITGSLAAGTYYLVVYGYQSTNSVGSWSVSIADMTTRQARTVSTNDSLADGTATMAGKDLGDVRTSIVTYNGTTSLSTANKWTAAQAGTGSGATNACRASGSDDDAHEHVLKFTVGTGASGATNRQLKLELTKTTAAFDPVMTVYSGSAGSLPVSGTLSTRILGCQRAYVANSPASKVFTGTPALTGTGDATTGGVLTGTFPPATYYVVIHAATAALNSAGNYKLVITDLTNDTVTPVAASGTNFSDTLLNSGGTGGGSGGTGNDTPYYDITTLTGAGFKYTGSISSSTADKWNGSQLGGNATTNCQSSGTSSRKRAEHVFKVTIPASTTVRASITETISSTSAVIAYYDASSISGIPQVGGSLGQPAACINSADNSYLDISNGTSAAKSYWVLIYPHGAPSSGPSYTGGYTLTLTMTTASYATTTAATGGNFSDGALNASISGAAPFLDFSTIDVTNTISYSGTTSLSTPTKWTHAQLGTASGRTATAGTANNAVPEHLFRFTTSSSANLVISLTGLSSQQVALSVFQSASVPQTHATLSPTSVQTSNTASASASVNGTYNGTYYVLVHGAQNGAFGSYTLSIGPLTSASTPVLQNTGNFSDSSLNNGIRTATFSNLDNSGNGVFGDLGTVTASRSAKYTGYLNDNSTETRWSSDNVATSLSLGGGTTGNGCRVSGGNGDDNLEHAFRFKLTGNLNTTVTLNSSSSDNLDAVITVFGPIASWGSSTPAAAPSTSSTAATTFNGGNSLTVSACNRANDATASVRSQDTTVTNVWGAGEYLVLVHAYQKNDDDEGTYTLTVGPTTAVATPYTATVADFGPLSATPKYYSGKLSASTSTTWSGTQMAVTGNATGCRSSTTSASYEHAFKFTLSSAAYLRASLNTNNGGTAFNGIVGVYGPISSWTNVPLSNVSALNTYGSTVQVCSNANQATGVINSAAPYGAGDYLVVVHGQDTNSAGDYTLTLQVDDTLMAGGNFTTALLNTSPTSPAMSAATFTTSTLNSSAVTGYGDFGTVTATQGYTYHGTTSTSTAKRWLHGAVVTANEGFYGCRYPTSARSDANYEHVFKVRLNTSATFGVNNIGGTDMWSVLSVFGPITGTFGTNVPIAGATTPAAAFNNGVAIPTSVCVLPTSGSNWYASTAVTTTSPGDYLVLVHTYDNNTSYWPTGTYDLSITPKATATHADFGTLGGTLKSFTGTLSSSTAKKWSSTNVGFSSVPNGCRTNSTSTSYEHAFKFTIGTGGTVTATLNTATGTSPFNGILSIYGPIADWTTAVPAVGTTLTGYGGTVASCTNINQSQGSVITSLAAGSYLVLVQGQDTSTAGNYTLSLRATTSPYATDSQNSALNATTSAVVANFGDVTSTSYHYEGSTASATTKWSNVHVGSTTASCRSTSSATTIDVVKEHAFKFNVTKATDLKITLSNPNWSGSGAKDWDSVVSLYGASTTDPSVAIPISDPKSCKQTSNASSVLDASLSAAGTFYLVVHGDTDSDSGAYKLSVQPNLSSSSPTATTANSLDYGLNGGANVPNVAEFGTLGTTPYYYNGNSTSAVSKWLGSDLATSVANSGATAATGCRQAAGTDTGEHVFKFTIPTGGHYVNIKVNPSGFDPVLSLFGPLSSTPTVDNPVGASATTRSCFHTASNNGTATNGTAVLEGTLTAGSYYVIVSGYASTASVPGAMEGGTYTLTVDPNATVTTTSRTVTQDDAGAEAQTPGSSGVVDLGTVNNFITTYGGTTSTSTANKWTAAQITSGVSSCRASTSQNTGREHLLKFTVSGATSLPLKVAVSGALDGVLSVFSGTQPAANSTLSNLKACSHRTAPAADGTTAGFTASAGEVTGTFAPGDYYAVVHAYNANNTGAYTLTVTDNSTTYTSSGVATNSTLSGGSGPQSGVDLGTVDGSLIVYTGDTTSALNKWTQAQVSGIGGTGCREAANDSGREHVMRFTVATARRVAMRVSTASATFQPVLTLLGNTAPTVNTTLGALACSHTSSTSATDNLKTGALTASNGLITGDLAAGTYYLLVHGYGSSAPQGAFTLSLLDADPESLGTGDLGKRIQVDGDTGNISFNQWQGTDLPADLNAVPFGGRYSAADATPERIYAFTIAGGTKTLTVALTGTFDSVLSVWNALPTSVSAGGAQPTGLLETQRSTGSYDRAITRSFDPGTYYVMVQGYRANNVATPPSGTYTLSVGDNAWSSSLIACNSRGTASKLTAQYLTEGEYYLVLKSGAGTGMLDLPYQYSLNIRRTFSQPFIACDHEGYGEGSRRGFLETTLEGGKTYAIVVRGLTPADRGTYGVVVRDMSSGTTPLGCANAAGYTTAPNNPNSFTADLEANREYFVVVRSNSDSDVGQTNVRISHAATSFCGFNNVTFDSVPAAGSSSGVSPYVPSKIVTKLPEGDYYAVVKGNQNLYQSSVKIPTGSTAGIPDDRGRGRYQISFGDASLATNNQQFTPPVWGFDKYGPTSADSLTKSGSNVILTKTAAGFGADVVGRTVTIENALNSANNGSFTITAQTATTLTFVNAAGISEAAVAARKFSMAASGTYAALKASGIRVITVNSISQHGSADLYMREQSKVISMGTGATDDNTYGPTSADSLTLSGSNIVLTKAGAGFASNVVGRRITISGASDAANNGTFIITASTATTLTYVNAAGSTEGALASRQFAISGFAIRKNIGDDGSGMGYAIVDAIADFAQAVQMDMSVRLAYLAGNDPGERWPYNRRFKFKARAVLPPAGTSNGCGAAVDSDGDLTLDTHPSCGPGATPRFEIQVTNPERGDPGDPALCVGGTNPGGNCDTNGNADCPGGYCTPGYPMDVPFNCPAPVAGCDTHSCRCSVANRYDPGMGYMMKLQLIGKDKLSASANPQIIDEIPLYVIPDQVFPDPDVVYPSEATYEQNVSSAGCMNGETPRWRSLHWEDKLPAGTSITWSICGRDTDAQLASCQDSDYVTVATVTPGNSCTPGVAGTCSNAWCNDPENDGTGICEKAVGRSCLTATDCGANAACVMNQCQYYGDPSTIGGVGVDLSGIWQQFDYKKRVRVRAKLKSNADHSLAPTIYDYKINYTCGQNE